MFFRLTIFSVLLLCGCRTGLIDCPEAKGTKTRHTIINTKNLKQEDLYVSSMNSKDRYDARSWARLKEQHEGKDPSTIEEWDCPRPGEQKNSKIVKNNIRRMEKKMNAQMKKRRTLDSLDHVSSYQYLDKP